MYASRPSRIELGSLNHVARGPRRRRRMIRRSIQPIMETVGITDITEIASSNPKIRRRRYRSIALPMQRSGAKFIVPPDTIWKSAKTFVEHKKMPPPAPVAQEPRRGEHHRADLDNEDQMGEINMIFGGSMSITSKTQRKKLEEGNTLAQHIEPERKMKWSDIDISFRPEDHPEIEPSKKNLPFVVKLSIR
jgi:hypothetical protein